MNIPIFRRLIFITISGLLVAGCESVPQLPVAVDAKPIPEDAIATSGRGGYEWPKEDESSGGSVP